MAKKKCESPEEEAIRMTVIRDKKAQLHADAKGYQDAVDRAPHLGNQLSGAMKKATDQVIKGMTNELEELHWKTEVALPKDPVTRRCLNTGQHVMCPQTKPKTMNFRCDLCGEINIKL